jgi:trk system potassium uptake protein TrkH
LRQKIRGPLSKWEIERGQWRSFWQRVSPPQLFVGSFALLIALGTIGLKTLPGLYTGQPLTWLEALFTTTSAVCVTGLIVVDTATFFTFWGQAYILLLIQLGGLGMLAFASLIILALGRRLSLRQESLYTDSCDVAPHVEPRRLARDIVLFTLAIEAIGALLLYGLWIPRLGWRGAIWPAIFHSVSAFCNAGFSTFSDSLISFQQSPLSLIVVMLLIVIGGLGFLTLEEAYLWCSPLPKKSPPRVSLHSRIALATTAVLIVVGWVLFTIFEWNHTLAELPYFHRLVNGMFLSITPRTAGFNTINYGKATESTNFLTILLMMIGGSPGSTAGGVKTTTFAVIGLLAWSRLKGYETTMFWRRSIREETAERAVGLFVLAFGLVTAAVFVLTTTERRGMPAGSFLGWMFEAVSAFCTVGLTMGVTPDLSTVGRVTTILLMFLGRVGPLTLAAILVIRRSAASKFRYAYEEVVVG